MAYWSVTLLQTSGGTVVASRLPRGRTLANISVRECIQSTAVIGRDVTAHIKSPLSPSTNLSQFWSFVASISRESVIANNATRQKVAGHLGVCRAT